MCIILYYKAHKDAGGKEETANGGAQRGAGMTMEVVYNEGFLISADTRRKWAYAAHAER